MAFSLIQNKSPEQKFWEWFLRNEQMLFHFEKDQELIFDKLATEMAKINGNLTFEFGPIQNGKREFVISAGGIKDAFPSVVSLASFAPKLNKWTVTKFRPRRTDLSTIQIETVKVNPSDVTFIITPNNHQVDITLYLGDKHTFNRELYGQIGFLFLDESLGEYDVEMLVGQIDFLPRSEDSGLKKYPLSDLTKRFDELVKQMSN